MTNTTADTRQEEEKRKYFDVFTIGSVIALIAMSPIIYLASLFPNTSGRTVTFVDNLISFSWVVGICAAVGLFFVLCRYLIFSFNDGNQE